ncbi:hypothetical protein Thimo_1780 [Thioflavicoccus mobilis 8321]|uniref:Uncharacterized protein n=1 Tax=Thioflavicoccus mobilis 8321 TaxID=765912 RepID=L0GX58_9GAMM|nr:hypothetical protein [Thioflavicoccus mobilis]AGA90551.1 hypothetical protein Thimo_1780 [Thioflavicoccus mobilis 8321]
MYIAPGFKHSDWKRLHLDDPNGPDWDTAISILKSRIRSRYIDPVDMLIDCDESKPYESRTFGFTILAIDSLLIETLQAFKDGRKATNKGDGKCAFLRFLTTSPSMKPIFEHDVELAEKFYTDYRCGILHQGEIQNNSLVWSIGADAAFFKEDDENPERKQIVVNRTQFHKNIKSDFAHYLLELRDSVNRDLRRNFRRKMDYICGTK